MLVIAIIILAVVLLALISKRKPAPPGPATDDAQRDRAANDGMIFGETPADVREGGELPDDVTPGCGDFGGGGSSGGWDSGDGGGD